jgi:hypothetical protein
MAGNLRLLIVPVKGARKAEGRPSHYRPGFCRVSKISNPKGDWAAWTTI